MPTHYYVAAVYARHKHVGWCVRSSSTKFSGGSYRTLEYFFFKVYDDRAESLAYIARDRLIREAKKQVPV